MFVDKLLGFAARYPELMVLTGDLGYAVFEPFIKEFPDKFINVGIAEQNMIGMGAGLALSGKKVFVYSITPFATARPMEQIRMDICYHKLQVRIIGTGAGLSYGTLGPSHHGTEDLALMRSMPNMTVTAPADRFELAQIMEAGMEMDGPLYIRMGRSKEPDIHAAEPKLEIGKGIEVCSKGDDFAIIACGNMVWTAVEAAKKLGALGKNGRVISMHTIKPIDGRLVLKLGKAMPIFTLEEHSVVGGLGSAVAECLADASVAPVCFERIALPDAFQQKVGTHDYLRGVNGLVPDKVASRIASRLNP